MGGSLQVHNVSKTYQVDGSDLLVLDKIDLAGFSPSSPKDDPAPPFPTSVVAWRAEISALPAKAPKKGTA
jgi:hypothetical protein